MADIRTQRYPVTFLAENTQKPRALTKNKHITKYANFPAHLSNPEQAVVRLGRCCFGQFDKVITAIG